MIPAEVRAMLAPIAQPDAPIGPLTTYRVGGRAELLVTVQRDDDLELLSRALGAAEEAIPLLVVGNGSNLLVADAGFAGVALVLGDRYAAVEIVDDRVRAGGVASLPVVARRTAAAGLTGFEWAVGVPGSIGGAVRMNAGGHGSDMAATLVGIRRFDLRTGEDTHVLADHLDLGFRHSNVTSHQLVLEAQLQLRHGDRATSEATVAEIVRWRRENQPGGANAGSVFVNPPGDSAGRLVDEAGCKGLRQGTAHVSPKHANFIQADEGGSADDIFALMLEVQRRVAEHSGRRLRPETRLIGFPPSALDVASYDDEDRRR
jgi:UDP-N-acetylmuramate dehydrogenase